MTMQRLSQWGRGYRRRSPTPLATSIIMLLLTLLTRTQAGPTFESVVNPTSFLTLLDATDGVSASCKAAARAVATNKLLAAEAVYASTPVEGLYLAQQLVFAPSGGDPTNLSVLATAGYPITNLGNPDACAYLPDMKYCWANLLSFLIRFGACVPQECSEEDIKAAIQLPLDVVCEWPHNYTPGTYIMIVVTFLLLGILALTTGIEVARNERELKRQRKLDQLNGTSNAGAETRGILSEADLMDEEDLEVRKWYEKDTTLIQLLLCFSLVKNWKLLVAPNRGGAFDSLDGMRSLSMAWVIFGHTFIFGLFTWGFTNMYEVLGFHGQGFLATYSAQALTGGYFAVDSFFFFAAFLAVYLLLENVTKIYKKKKTVWPFVWQVPKLYLLRWVRLTPTYFFVLLMYWQVLRIVGTGPFGGMQFYQDDKLCRNGWWVNLLYLNNFIVQELPGMPSQSCYPVSWYLANDFQFFLFAPFIALLAFWNHRVSLVILGAGTLGSILYSHIEAIKEQWTIDFLEQSTYFEGYYIKPWTRCPAYIIGAMLAIVWWFHFRENKAALLPNWLRQSATRTRLFVWSLLAIALALFGATVLGGQGAYANTPPAWSADLMGAYIAWSKPAWTVGLAILSFLMFVGEGGAIKSFLECRAFTITSRLAYCSYLIHPAVINWYYDSLIAPIHFTRIWYALMFMGFISLVLILSIAVHLMVERPVANIERMFRNRSTKPSKPTDYSKAVNGNGLSNKAESLNEPLLAADTTPLGSNEAEQEMNQ